MKIGIFGNEYQREEQIIKILDILKKNQVEIFIQKDFYDYMSCRFDFKYDIAGIIECGNFSLDMAFSVGGDGTFLKTASIIGNKDIPILGINTGRLGFLADISEADIESTLGDIMQGKFRVEKRSQLTLTTDNHTYEGYNYALNEIAILKQDTASMLTIDAYINDEHLTTYQSDGLIISTPTGSTAYSLSVGGPIMTPTASNIIIAAIAPHSLTTRPLVVEDEAKLTFVVKSRNQNFLVSLDGRSEILSTGIVLKVQKGEYPLKVVKRIGHTFYATLRDKLMWGIDSRS
jgi:NAD+ kinase